VDWKEYQEQVAEFFRSLGLDAETDVTLQGVRTKHDVDVLVKSHHVGFDITWVVECKNWATKISKLHVLALREIVNDLGADRGILLSEQGFQSGAVEAATLTNVHVTSLVDINKTASDEIFSMRLRELGDLLIECRKNYWEIPKQRRIDCGLRPDVGVPGYSAAKVIEVVDNLFARAFGGSYPFDVDALARIFLPHLPTKINSVQDLVETVEPLIEDLEDKLNKCIGNNKQSQTYK
jgi:hypothetical protein